MMKIDRRKKTQSEILEEFFKVHGNEYDYSKFEYNGVKKKSCIVCKKCKSEFWQTPDNHKSKKQGCPNCRGNIKLTIEDFVKQSSIVHKNKYNYPNAIYRGNKSKIAIECKVHGEFLQIASLHLNKKYGCPKCAGNYRYSQKEFIEHCIKERGLNYIYDETKYLNNKKNVIIGCKLHGNFNCTPNNFLRGTGCPKCVSIISKKEILLQSFIKSLGFEIQTNNRDLLKGKELDIYIPSLNKAIEFNGTYWHYHPDHFVPGKHAQKSKMCKEIGITLIHIREDLWSKNPQKMEKVIKKFLKDGRKK